MQLVVHTHSLQFSCHVITTMALVVVLLGEDKSVSTTVFFAPPAACNMTGGCAFSFCNDQFEFIHHVHAHVPIYKPGPVEYCFSSWENLDWEWQHKQHGIRSQNLILAGGHLWQWCIWVVVSMLVNVAQYFLARSIFCNMAIENKCKASATCRYLECMEDSDVKTIIWETTLRTCCLPCKL